ncbi:EthD family reductase [Deinococcus aquiradiocola]|uniref:Ethyl tert-butyl ether degradation protein EthD n=1 Tax=Deinococcus aquiradiocola TaxID=393059 RepID=A0A917PCS3_9DEIO|nr:EthD family reductase [Deinococcus aquiradiocola]GGJ70852.1 ethyl tert-butyl ether degradation protein EthD [Deinococcus aquiradiocola]
MHRMIVLYPFPEDPAAFLAHYQDTHASLVLQLQGLRDFRYGKTPPLGAGERPYDLIAHLDFDDEASMMAAMTSEHGQCVAADVPNSSPGGATILHQHLTVPGR